MATVHSKGSRQSSSVTLRQVCQIWVSRQCGIVRKLWKPWPSSSRAWRSSRCPIAAVTRSSVKPSPAKYAGRDDNLIGQGHKGEVGGVLEGDHAHLEQRAMHHLKTAATVCLVCVLVRVGGMGSKVGTCNKEHLSITAVNQICQSQTCVVGG